MIVVTSPIGNKITLEQPACRIISLVPSITELLSYLELERETIGITLFCIHPKHWFKTKTRVGGTKKINRHLIGQLKPDLILANKEENTREDIEHLMEQFQVYVSDVKNLNDAVRMIGDIGRLTGKDHAATFLNTEILSRFEVLKRETETSEPLSCLYLIWNDPLMTVGGDTFISHILESGGYINSCRHLNRYPVISRQTVEDLKPDFVFLSSEPFPFGQKHVGLFSQWFDYSKVVLVDGTCFSWYGSRLLQTPEYLRKLRNRLIRNA